MYVCICKGVSEKDLAEVISEGHQSLQDVQARCGAGTDCGSCSHKVVEILNKCVPLPKAAEFSKASSDE